MTFSYVSQTFFIDFTFQFYCRKFKMVSRRKILNRSREDLLNIDQEEEDIWFQKEKLYKVS